MVIERCLIPDFRQRLQSARAVLERLPASAKSIPPLPAYRHSNGVLCLRVMQGMDYGQVFRLKDLLQGTKRIITIGRDRGNSLCLRDGEYPRLSRRHCTLETDLQGRWFVRDGQWVTGTKGGYWKASVNGTYLNSLPVYANGHELQPGDILTLGDITLRVERI